MGKHQAFQKTLWAVDVFAEDFETHHAVPALLALQKAGVSYLEACTVLGPRELDQKEQAREVLERLLRVFRPEMESAAVVLGAPSHSTRQGVRLLLDHAVRAGADAIVVSTHARKGMDRLFLGSFAETLLLHSRIPVLSVNPHATPLPFFKHVLFPTDFSPRSELALDLVLDLVRRAGAQLTLFHGVTHPRMLRPPGLVAYQQLEQEMKDSRQAMAAWVERARRSWSAVTGECAVVPGGLVAALVTAASTSGAKYIALDTRPVPGGGLSLGGTPRQLVRLAPVPVLTLPGAEAQGLS